MAAKVLLGLLVPQVLQALKALLGPQELQELQEPQVLLER